MKFCLELGSVTLGGLQIALDELGVSNLSVSLEGVKRENISEMSFEGINDPGSILASLGSDEYAAIRVTPRPLGDWTWLLMLTPSVIEPNWQLWKLIVDGITAPQRFRLERFRGADIVYAVLSIEDTIDINANDQLSDSKFPSTDWRIVEYAFGPAGSCPFEVINKGPAFSHLSESASISGD